MMLTSFWARTERSKDGNGTESFKNVKNCLNTNILLLETSGGKSSYLYLNVVHFFNTSVNLGAHSKHLISIVTYEQAQ